VFHYLLDIEAYIHQFEEELCQKYRYEKQRSPVSINSGLKFGKRKGYAKIEEMGF